MGGCSWKGPQILHILPLTVSFYQERKGIKIFEELKLTPALSNGQFFLGELYENTGRKDEALTNLNKALSMCQEMGIEYWPDKIQEVLDRLQ